VTTTMQPRPTAVRVPPRIVVPIVLGALLNALNSSMIAVALVGIQQEFHAGPEVVWLVSGLYLATAVGQPTMGRLADQLGARRVFSAGLLFIMLAAVLAPFAPSLGWLLAARVGLGLGTSAAYPAGMSLIRDWAEQQQAGAQPTGGLGAISMASQVAVALGPPLGGVLVEFAGWRSIFWVNLPLAGLSLVLTLIWIRADGPMRARRLADLSRELDPVGIVLFAGALISLLLFLLSVSDSPQWWDLGATAVLLVALIGWERRAARAFIDVRMLAANRALSATYVRCAVTYVVFYTVFYALPQWLEQGRSMSTLESGLVMLPVAGLGAIATVMATRLTDRRGLWPVLVIGSGGLLVGSLGLSGVTQATPIMVLLVVAAVLGLPNGFNSLGNQAAMYDTAPRGQLGTASGLYRTAQYVGANLASALVGLGLSGRATDGGLHLLAWVISAISAGLLITALTSKHLRAHTRQRIAANAGT
jgi:MFS family permease